MTAGSSRIAVPDRALPDVAWLRQPRLPFAVRVEHASPDVAIVILQGEVDTHTSSVFRDTVTAEIDAGAGAIVVDLSEVSFIDATGLGVIVFAARRMDLGSVALVLPHRGLVRIFRICGLDRLLDIYETRERALSGLLG